MALRAALLLVIIGPFGVLHAQEKEDHLEPVRSIYDILDYQFEYYSTVRKVLFEGLTDFPEIRFQIMPSFSPESVLDLEVDRQTNKYFLVYHICDKMIWRNEKWKEIKVNSYRTEIDQQSADTLVSLFDKAVSLTRFPEDEIMGLDGVKYFFSVSSFGLRTGMIWSPSEGTKMKRLVTIGLDLVELAKQGDSIIKLDSELLSKIAELSKDLK